MRVTFRIQGNNGSLWCRSNSRLSEFEPLLTATRRPLWNQHGYTNVIKPFGFSLFYETKCVSQFDHTYIDSVVFVTLANWFCMLDVNIVALVCGLAGWLLCVFAGCLVGLWSPSYCRELDAGRWGVVVADAGTEMYSLWYRLSSTGGSGLPLSSLKGDWDHCYYERKRRVHILDKPFSVCIYIVILFQFCRSRKPVLLELQVVSGAEHIQVDFDVWFSMSLLHMSR